MSIENLAQYFSTIEDPRCSGKVEHRLVDVLVIAVCAVIACAECWHDITLYVKRLAIIGGRARHHRRFLFTLTDNGGAPMLALFACLLAIGGLCSQS